MNPEKTCETLGLRAIGARITVCLSGPVLPNSKGGVPWPNDLRSPGMTSPDEYTFVPNWRGQVKLRTISHNRQK